MLLQLDKEIRDKSVPWHCSVVVKGGRNTVYGRFESALASEII